MELHPGAHLLAGFVPPDEQRALVELCLALGAQPAGFYRPTHRSGGQMSVRMMCLGRHWNAQTYVYEPTRSDHDDLPVSPIPPALFALAARAALASGMPCEPDICLVNHYIGEARLGLHRDSDERPETRAAGVPIISVSLGADAEYLLGGLRRQEPTAPIRLRSGDVIVLGGPSRMRYHAVTGIHEGTGPATLPLEGRLNLTFRRY
jgi:alkylated DNA repair protein (DNA oxidative demethylase)